VATIVGFTLAYNMVTMAQIKDCHIDPIARKKESQQLEKQVATFASGASLVVASLSSSV